MQRNKDVNGDVMSTRISILGSMGENDVCGACFLF